MYGYYVDHVIDMIGTMFLLGGLALSGYMTPMVALGLLVGFLMLSAETYLAAHACGIFRLSLLRVGATELRILLAVAQAIPPPQSCPTSTVDLVPAASIRPATSAVRWSSR